MDVFRLHVARVSSSRNMHFPALGAHRLLIREFSTFGRLLTLNSLPHDQKMTTQQRQHQLSFTLTMVVSERLY